MHIYIYIYIYIYTVLSILINDEVNPNVICTKNDNILWFIYIMEYYSVMKRDKILLQATLLVTKNVLKGEKDQPS
jgi:hypothetical protein